MFQKRIPVSVSGILSAILILKTALQTSNFNACHKDEKFHFFNINNNNPLITGKSKIP